MKTAVISAQGISKEVVLGNNQTISIFKDISLTTYAGEFLSIVGPSGSGKSTLLKALSGLLPPTSGSIRINQINPYELRPSQIAKVRRSEIGFIFQSYNLVPALPVFENIVLPMRLSGQKIERQVVAKLLRDMRFNADINSAISSLSGGEQQKVAIARVLLTKAKIVFADEPTGAVDSVSREIIFNLLKDLTHNGACVVMVTHDVELATKTDRTMVLKDGCIKQIFTKPDSQTLLNAIEAG